MIQKFLSGIFCCAILAFVSLNKTSAHPSVDVVASNWKFTPATIEAHVGKKTTLHLSSSEGVHGIISDELGIPKTTILPNKAVEVSFTPKKAGTYKVHCAIPCGQGHDDMTVTVKVLS